jgi:hypothetical protein
MKFKALTLLFVSLMSTLGVASSALAGAGDSVIVPTLGNNNSDWNNNANSQRSRFEFLELKDKRCELNGITETAIRNGKVIPSINEFTSVNRRTQLVTTTYTDILADKTARIQTVVRVVNFSKKGENAIVSNPIAMMEMRQVKGGDIKLRRWCNSTNIDLKTTLIGVVSKSTNAYYQSFPSYTPIGNIVTLSKGKIERVQGGSRNFKTLVPTVFTDTSMKTKIGTIDFKTPLLKTQSFSAVINTASTNR